MLGKTKIWLILNKHIILLSILCLLNFIYKKSGNSCIKINFCLISNSQPKLHFPILMVIMIMSKVKGRDSTRLNGCLLVNTWHSKKWMEKDLNWSKINFLGFIFVHHLNLLIVVGKQLSLVISSNFVFSVMGWVSWDVDFIFISYFLWKSVSFIRLWGWTG